MKFTFIVVSYNEVEYLSQAIDSCLNQKLDDFEIVIGDDGLLCVGSFNWFSATREARYERYDTSMVYSGDNLKGEIEAIYNSLERRQV